MNRSAEEHRVAVEAWRATAPAADHKIFGRKLKSDKPRHRDLSELSALLAMRSRPIGVAEGDGVAVEPVSLIATNWRLFPSNDNELPHDDADLERAVEFVPSVDMIMREVSEGDIEYGLHIDENGKGHKVVVRWGRLRFSDGSQKERGHKLILDKVVDADLEMPVGAMLGCREKSVRDKGTETDSAGSNAHYRRLVKGRVATPPKLTPKKEDRVAISKAAARTMLADAISNTPVMPPTKICPDGLPYRPSNLRQLFIGGRKGRNGESGSMAWEDKAGREVPSAVRIYRLNRSCRFHRRNGSQRDSRSVLRDQVNDFGSGTELCRRNHNAADASQNVHRGGKSSSIECRSVESQRGGSSACPYGG